MPALRLTAGKPASTRTARKSPARKPAAAKAPTRKPKPAAKQTAAKAEPTAVQGPRLPDGWTKREFDTMLKQMAKAMANKASAQDALDEAATAVNTLALDAIANGVQMSVVSDTLSLSRQWLYKLMDDAGVQTSRQASKPHPNKGLTQDQIEAKAAKAAAKPARAAKPKPAAKRAAKPAAKRTPTRKPAASAGRRSPARKAPARSGGNVRLARR